MPEAKLNSSQKLAVDHTFGPLLVVAGAGTGKTRVIVDRIVRLIESGVDPESILALTFTEKAAQEMVDRVNERRGGYTLDATIATYNGFGNELLQEFAAEIGLPHNMKLLGDTSQLVFLREHLDELDLDYYAPVSKPDSQLDILSDYFSRLKQQLIQPDAYIDYAKKLPRSNEEEKLEHNRHNELARAYKKYIELCRQEGVIDYDDQLFLVMELLKKRPNIARLLRDRYQYILVDEFQDTNPMQSALINAIYKPTEGIRLRSGELISEQSRESQASRIDNTVKRDSQGFKPKGATKSAAQTALLADRPTVERSLMVVGDDDQSIYGWRGATLTNILDFKKRYPKTAEVTLTENYRSIQSILDISYRLIQHNNPNRLEIINKLDKKLHGTVKKGSDPTLVHFTSFDSEVSWVAEDISRRIDKGQEPGTIAVLARRNQGTQKIHDALELRNIDHVVAGLRADLYRQPAVSHIIEALRAVHDINDNTALYHVLTGPLFSVLPQQISAQLGKVRAEHTPLATLLDTSTDKGVARAITLLQAWRTSSANASVGQLAYRIVTDTNYVQELYKQSDNNLSASLQLQAIGQFFRTLKDFEKISTVPSLNAYMDNLPALQAAGNELQDDSLDISSDKVNVLSIHKAKGLEWQTVYIIDCTEGSFPLRGRTSSLQVPEELTVHTEADDQLAEERRLMYVAATRAREELILGFSDTHTGTTKRRPSRFLQELFDHDPAEVGLQLSGEQTSIDLFAPKNEQQKTSLPASMKQGDQLVLSVSQVDTYLRCPQDFYYLYVLQIPQPPNPVLEYGTAIHGFIQRLHTATKNDLSFDFDAELETVKQALPQAGYWSAKQRERAHAQALKSIDKIHKRFQTDAIPAEIEKSFRIQVADTGLTLKGRIDAVYASEDGQEIRDYKTGTSVTTADKAKKRAQASQQLSLYALAWQILFDELPSSLTLDFVETNQQGSVRKQPKTIENLQQKLGDMVKDIESGNFQPGKDHTYCSHPL